MALLLLLAGVSGAGALVARPLDFPSADPFVLTQDGDTLLFTTNRAGLNVPVYRSADMRDWTLVGDALPILPAWARKGYTWAPEAIHYAGRYWLFYTARSSATTLPCIGLAEGTEPQGPYHDSAQAPLVCMDAKGGAIDASPFVDGEKLYLLWKANGNRLKIKTAILLARLDPIARQLSENPQVLLENDEPWEGISVEAPTLVKMGGHYHLFYSGAMFHTPNYAVGYATADAIEGPYRKFPGNPILKSDAQLLAPGHQSIFTDSMQHYWIAYHAYPGAIEGRKRVTTFRRLDPPSPTAEDAAHATWTIQPPIAND